jgi:uncharacterized protein YajQ (UPF0234 family)
MLAWYHCFDEINMYKSIGWEKIKKIQATISNSYIKIDIQIKGIQFKVQK